MTHFVVKTKLIDKYVMYDMSDNISINFRCQVKFHKVSVFRNV
jgi:hypothetical protein